VPRSSSSLASLVGFLAVDEDADHALRAAAEDDGDRRILHGMVRAPVE
jgi:hypothetical protein